VGLARIGVLHNLLYGTSVLLAWSVACLVFSLRQPRRHLRTVALSPGFVVNAAAIAGVLCTSIHYAGQAAID
jgi:hypothetical protein